MPKAPPTKYLLIRTLRTSELGWFAAVRRQGREKGKQRGINFNTEIMTTLFPSGLRNQDEIEVVTRRISDKKSTKRSLRRQQKNWRLVGDQVDGHGLERVDAGDFFWALATPTGTHELLLEWDVILKKASSAEHRKITQLTSSALGSGMAIWPTSDPVASQIQKTLSFSPEDTALSRPSSPDPREAPAISQQKKHTAHFKPRARLLQLLGDELIRHHRLALFELVKNAYDADSPSARITFHDIEDPKEARIDIHDEGEGMDFATISQVWLEPGSQHRAEQRAQGIRTQRFHRLPVGEKGIGRFAAHKLGNRIRLVTRRIDHPEIVVEIDWEDLSKNKYLEDATVTITERPPVDFINKSGTHISISQLRQAWRRGDARRLSRAVSAMASPFETKDSFKPSIVFSPDPGWLQGLSSAEDLNKLAMFSMDFELTDEGFSYAYTFTPLPGLKADHPEFIKPRQSKKAPTTDFEFFSLMAKPAHQATRTRQTRPHPPLLKALGIGRIKGRIIAFDRERDIISSYISDQSGLESYLNEQGGIRVYRDGLRVYDYGEPGNDWLGLDVRRVQIPTMRVSNNIIIGEIHLRLNESTQLLEKTNREGFVENAAFEELQYATLCAVSAFEEQRAVDKSTIRKAMELDKDYQDDRLSDGPLVAMHRLKQRALREGVYEKIGKDIEQVERVYKETHETLLSAVGAGLGLSMIFHELERGVRNLYKALDEPTDLNRVRTMALHLVEMLDGTANLVRATDNESILASKLIAQTQFVIAGRLKYHNIKLTNAFQHGAEDFKIKGSRRMLIASITNLLDNSIYWLKIRHPSAQAGERNIWIGPSFDLDDGPAIIIADNGKGFTVPPEEAVQPFRTSKTDGMGLGLYFVNLTMKAHEGRLAFPKNADAGVPQTLDGASVAMVFKGVK